ncbi:prolyl oligopeptidase family serine peptidase [Mucilaginibacter sp. BJC16-A38]|uniref:alpha/beta hydrolase family protein n=1 Tax=Mucilaginibacter phenanthrenivorans TaxID=1234842 RepID=UPI002157FC82|nr:prolyl oligopeptidase family serine peptidase [Mucilaginibacter phenanthrenivorans]MCR8556987.1 prolyl oligopeptidase family serine peptidase [Mucilaginibacter phenanthrenivorans]
MIKSNIIVVIALLVLSGKLAAQDTRNSGSKPLIDTNAINQWQPKNIQISVISPKGRYAAYVAQKQLTEKYSLVIIDNKGNEIKEYPGGGHQCFFSKDDRVVAIQTEKSLHLLKLSNAEEIRSIPATRCYPNTSMENNGEWVAYTESTGTKQMTLLNLLTGKEQPIGQYIDATFDKNGKSLFVKDTVGGIEKLKRIDLINDTRENIWSADNAKQKMGLIRFDTRANQIAFIVSENGASEKSNSIWFWNGAGAAALKLRDGDARISENKIIKGGLTFSKNGKWLFFELAGKEIDEIKQKPSKDAVMLDVWSYRDSIIQPTQTIRGNEPKVSIGILATAENSFFQLGGNERLMNCPPMVSSDFIVVSSKYSSSYSNQIKKRNVPLRKDDVFPFEPSLYYILSLKNGAKTKLFDYHDEPKRRIQEVTEPRFFYSPNGRWLVYQRPDKDRWFSYDLKFGKVNKISHMKLPVNNRIPGSYMVKNIQENVAGWANEGNDVLMYGNYDILNIDLAGKHPLINLTGGYGNRNHVQLRFFQQGFDSIYSFGDTLRLRGFNIVNKYNCFYSQVLGRQKEPGVLFRGPYLFDFRFNFGEYVRHTNAGMEPLKAKNANAWIVQRQSATEFPNFFYTTDFHSFTRLTNLEPQQKYNWLTAEVINYKTLDGIACQGVLYKPGNFDPKKKYPVIFNYYELMSDGVYSFPKPALTFGNINVPWFVSRGYLVFKPDIPLDFASESGKTVGEHTLNSVVAAAKFLAKLPFVDGKHIGIQGHSFGGYETNYLATHTGMFAAASEMSGVSDEVSVYLTLNGDEIGATSQHYAEAGQGRIGTTLWQKPEWYIKASPVLKADKVSTPLLIVQNKGDAVVPWRQGVEMYMALRRLEKPSWMLQYDGENHDLDGNKACFDYTIRLTQFFDHYLKGYPPPVWMTKGVPARLKGIETGYSLDPDGSCGPNCPICKKKDYSKFDPKLAIINDQFVPHRTPVAGIN